MTWKAPKTAALVMVDPQIDFCPGGLLAVPDGDLVVPVLNRLRAHFESVYLTQDWHPAGHLSFASSHGRKPFEQISMEYGMQTLWPDHCIQNSFGAKFHPDLKIGKDDLILQKGTDKTVDSYSAFFENDHKTRPKFPFGKTFTQVLHERGIKTLVFGGLVREICVAWNALDAVSEGFRSVIVLDATQRLNAVAEAEMTARLRDKNIILLQAAQLESFFKSKMG